ncbi:MAG: methyltransferase domain-containing protein [Mycobacteriales bacterium]
MSAGASVGREWVTPDETRVAQRAHWDSTADDYQSEHGEFLGDVRFVWCPEGLDEADAHLLGDVRGLRILEVGCGAAQCGRWLVSQGASVVAFDLSMGQLRHAVRLNQRSGVRVSLVAADAEAFPFRDESFDVVFTSFGAIGFVQDSALLMREAARVLRPGGRWVFSWSHPIRWAFPDDGGKKGLTLSQSYFDRTPYVETGEDGVPNYVEHHRTIGDRVREITAAGLRLVDVIEPEWPDDPNHPEWAPNWSALRGKLIPGTAIWVTEKPTDP